MTRFNAMLKNKLLAGPRVLNFGTSLWLLIAVGVTMCVEGCADKPAPPKEVPSTSQKVRPGKEQVTIGTAKLWVEVARDPEKRQKGLMLRQEMPWDEGMLFIFDQPEMLSFWMKDTYLPLDIAFMDVTGAVTDIHEMTPLDTMSRYESSVDAKYALEVNRGWFASNNIAVGSRMRLY